MPILVYCLLYLLKLCIILDVVVRTGISCTGTNEGFNSPWCKIINNKIKNKTQKFVMRTYS